MFLNHFQFTTQPFAERVAAAALWQDDRMQQGLARLRYLAEQATVALVTGASGVGKSALLKRFLHELHGPRWQPVYLHLTHLSAAGLLKLLVGKLGEPPRRGKERLFEQILGKARQAEGGLLVILDEAHLIDADALTDIRLLISSALDDAPPLKVVLVPVAGRRPKRSPHQRGHSPTNAQRVPTSVTRPGPSWLPQRTTPCPSTSPATCCIVSGMRSLWNA
jgi:general secretion pathway protein A